MGRSRGSWTTSRRCSSWRALVGTARRRPMRRTRHARRDVGASRAGLQTARQQPAAPCCRRCICSSRAKRFATARGQRQGGNGDPEYPAPGAQFDLWFATAPRADTKLEVLDAQGTGRAQLGLAAARAGGRPAQEMRGPSAAGGGGAGSLRARSRDAALHLGHALSRPVVAEARTAARRADGAAGQIHRAPHRGRRRRRRAAFELKADPRVLARRRDAGGHRGAGHVSAEGPRCHQRRAQAAAAGRGGDEEGRRPPVRRRRARRAAAGREVRASAAAAVGAARSISLASTRSRC